MVERNSAKCSACRGRKIKCEPENRIWDQHKQKCISCDIHGEECGPNLRKKHDPKAIGSRQARRDKVEPSVATRVTVPVMASPSTGAIASAQRGDRPGQSEEIHHILDRTKEELKEKASAGWLSHSRRKGYSIVSDTMLTATRWKELNELGILSQYYAVQVTLASKQGYSATVPYEDLSKGSKMFKEAAQSLYIRVAEYGFQADTRAQTELAQLILTQLLLALKEYPELCDDRNRFVLQKMEAFFQRLEDLYTAQQIRSTLAELSTLTKSSLRQDYSRELAESYLTTSASIRSTQVKVWQEKHGLDGVPPNLALPPLQRAAVLTNPFVIAAVVTNSASNPATYDIINQQGLHIAAILGSTEFLNRFIQEGNSIDARDLFQRTPLFLAAMHGHAEVCVRLLEASADIRSRDIKSHTILEVAARGGHLITVQQLINFGAEVNPELAYGTSTPLQAAIESTPCNIQLVNLLLEKGANLSTRRHDGDNAMDLAVWNGLFTLAPELRQKFADASQPQPEHSDYYYDQGFISFMG